MKNLRVVRYPFDLTRDYVVIHQRKNEQIIKRYYYGPWGEIWYDMIQKTALVSLGILYICEKIGQMITKVFNPFFLFLDRDTYIGRNRRLWEKWEKDPTNRRRR